MIIYKYFNIVKFVIKIKKGMNKSTLLLYKVGQK